jgi:hypothetical protein
MKGEHEGKTVIMRRGGQTEWEGVRSEGETVEDEEREEEIYICK